MDILDLDEEPVGPIQNSLLLPTLSPSASGAIDNGIRLPSTLRPVPIVDDEEEDDITESDSAVVSDAALVAERNLEEGPGPPTSSLEQDNGTTLVTTDTFENTVRACAGSPATTPPASFQEINNLHIDGEGIHLRNSCGGEVARAEAPMSEPALRQAIKDAVLEPVVRYDRIPASSPSDAEARVREWDRQFKESYRNGNVLFMGISGATVHSPRPESWPSVVDRNPFDFPPSERLWSRINLLANGVPSPAVPYVDHVTSSNGNPVRPSKAHRRKLRYRD